MKRKLKFILAALCAVLFLSLMVWWLWPRSLEQISGLDFDQATSLSADMAAVTDFSWNETTFTHYKLDGETAAPGGEHFDPLLSTFKAIKAYPSPSNLLRPWLLTGEPHYLGAEVLHGSVTCGDSTVFFLLTDRGELVINSRLFDTKNKAYFNHLRMYVTTYGEKIEN